MDAIICTDIDEFNAINDRVKDWLETTTGATMARWAWMLTHPVTGDVALQVDLSRMAGALTMDELARVETLTPDWIEGAGS